MEQLPTVLGYFIAAATLLVGVSAALSMFVRTVGRS